MPMIHRRTRFFLAVEGDGEQSFVKWLQGLSTQLGLHIHLDCHPLGGGGYKTMLERAVYELRRGLIKGTYREKFLIVDADRSEDEDWTIAYLKQQAERHGMVIYTQKSNQEGLLLKMIEGNEHINPDAASAQRRLLSLWPDYRKPIDTYGLERRYIIDDLYGYLPIERQAEVIRGVGQKKPEPGDDMAERIAEKWRLCWKMPDCQKI